MNNYPWHYDEDGNLLTLEEYYEWIIQDKRKNKNRFVQIGDDKYRWDERIFMNKLEGKDGTTFKY
jgi:hypothetical protein